MLGEMLVVEDVLLLMLDDKTGAVTGAGTYHYTLGGAVLVELALRGRVEIDQGGSWLSSPKVRAAGDGPLPDPLLQSAYDKVAQGGPRHVQTVLMDLGADLWQPVVDRLVERGLIRRESRRVLGLFRTTRLPVDDARHEEELRRKVRAVLEEGEDPDARTAAVIALISASGVLPSLHPAIRWSGKVYKRAKEFEQGNWGAVAVNTAVSGTTAAIAASNAAVSAAITTVITSGRAH
ncbi:GOLPH3/VPS74 family protein [Phytohabitans kaempferiae]|uniref:GPP34 family phosphoprotein n=1 Tax=Phytohabitans kaempferiae TaxID=1620943 RepID=A0ABV6MBK3_9ACTN